MPSIAIVSKPQKPELQGILRDLLQWLQQRSMTAVLDETSACYVDQQGIQRESLPAHKPDLVVVLGGDGTLLSVARAFAQTSTPLLSVNLGSLGFLTEVPLEELYRTLEAWCEGTSDEDERGMMRVTLTRTQGEPLQWDVLNDVVLTKGAIARIGEYVVELDGELVAKFRADGVIVSTPTGSTAYNLAANGPIVMANVNATVVTPICPHLLTVRPIVVPGDAEIRLHVEGIADQTYLTIDGQEAVELKLGDQVHCVRSPYSVHLVRLGQHGLFNVLRSKLKWGQR
ncbi:NAD(+)/NADH kinase [Terriglobus aquaticus]|uniref:NAD kinase n=1 Tax=Terriglobus aquaticus TaxID=940139 RepID=A0ABW9KM49_9BACT|nr:NAD(+)/NADH kinase [Terriglobus aquaticus]